MASATRLALLLLPAQASGELLFVRAPASSETLPPCTRNRTLHLIRHAQGTHNEVEEASAASKRHLEDPTGRHAALQRDHGDAWVLLEEVTGMDHWDAPLTATGREQAYALRRSLRDVSLQLDAIIASPFRRTLQTALLSLPHLEQASTAFPISGVSPQHPPIITTDLVRERVGQYTCDFRLNVPELRSAFPNITIDFSHVSTEDEYYVNGRESGPREAELLQKRVKLAMDWISQLPDDLHEIALVSHKHFLQALSLLHPALDQRPFTNAEWRPVVMCDTGDGNGAQKTEL